MTNSHQAWFVYMLECRGGRLYTGVTTDIERRMSEHRGGRRGARFTRAHPPAILRAAVRVANRSEALKLEAALKRLRRAEKLAWATAQGICTADVAEWHNLCRANSRDAGGTA